MNGYTMLTLKQLCLSKTMMMAMMGQYAFDFAPINDLTKMLGMRGTDEERLNMFKNMTFKEFYTAHMSGGDWKTMETMAGKALQTEEMKMQYTTRSFILASAASNDSLYFFCFCLNVARPLTSSAPNLPPQILNGHYMCPLAKENRDQNIHQRLPGNSSI